MIELEPEPDCGRLQPRMQTASSGPGPITLILGLGWLNEKHAQHLDIFQTEQTTRGGN
jgi:hypothetical protein